MMKPAPGQHNFQILPCPATAHNGYWFFHCPRCRVKSQCFPSRRLAKIAGDQYHSGGTPVVGWDHSAAEA